MISSVCSAPSSSSSPPSLSLSLSRPSSSVAAASPPSASRATMRRDRMERFVILPFSIGCVSQSSVAVIDTSQPEKTRGEAKPPPEPSPQGETVVVLATDETRTSSSSDSHPRRSNNISVRLNKLVKSFKGLSSHLLAVYRVDEDEGEAEMEIGFPTDVKHVGHIGWDGGLPPPASKASAWDVGGGGGAPELISLSSISFRQFELAMSAQAEAPALAPAGGVEVA